MLLLLFSVLVAALCLLLARCRAKMRPVVQHAEKIPGPKALPLVGNALEFGTSTKGTAGQDLLIGPTYSCFLLHTFGFCVLNNYHTAAHARHTKPINTRTHTLLRGTSVPWNPEMHQTRRLNRNALTLCAVNLFPEFFDYILWLTRTHGPIARVWVGPVLAVLLADPGYIEVGHCIVHWRGDGVPGVPLGNLQSMTVAHRAGSSETSVHVYQNERRLIRVGTDLTMSTVRSAISVEHWHKLIFWVRQ